MVPRRSRPRVPARARLSFLAKLLRAVAYDTLYAIRALQGAKLAVGHLGSLCWAFPLSIAGALSSTSRC